MRKFGLFLILAPMLAFAGGKIQNADVKSLSELTTAGATQTSLINDTKIYLTGVGETLSAAVSDGSLITGSAWSKTGNSGTTAGTNFIGTTDGQAFVLKTNNIERMRILSGGSIGIGTSAPSASLDITQSLKIGTTLSLAGATSGQVAFKAAATSGNTLWTLPSTDGTSGQVLSTNGTGTLSWATSSGGGGSSALVGTVKITGCSSPFQTSSTSLANMGTQTGCSYTVTGSVSAPSTNVAGFKLATVNACTYIMQFDGTMGNSSANNTTQFAINDGTNTGNERAQCTGTGGFGCDSMNLSLVESAGSNVTFQVFAKVDAGTASLFGTTNNPLVIKVFCY